MRILITGNMGYIGPVLVKKLRESMTDLHITGVDTGYFADCLTGARFLPENLIDVQYYMDLRSLDITILKGVDTVVHLAAISNDPMGNEFEDITNEVNLRASEELACAAKAAGVKSFVFASSCSMYGTGSDEPRTEDAELVPLTAYAISKVGMEHCLEKLADRSFKVTSLRFSTACGMSTRIRLDLVLNDFVASALTTGQITVLSDGTPWRPLIHVQDMASAIEWGVTRESGNGGDFVAVNVGSNSFNYMIRDLAQATADCLEGTSVHINPDAQTDKRSYRVNFDKYEALAPNHQPIFGLKDCVEDILKGLRDCNFTDKNFRQSRLIRLVMLKTHQQAGNLDNSLRWIERRGRS